MLGSEVGSEVHDLPAPERDQQQRGTYPEPLNAGIRALVGVAQLLLARPQVVHLADDIRDGLLDAPQLRLDRLQLLRRLDRGPILGVGADVDVEFHVSARIVHARWFELVKSLITGVWF